MLQRFFLISSATVVAFSLAAASAEDDVITTSMKKFHKAPEGAEAICKKAGDGNATESDLASLLASYQAIAVVKPPKGDDASWKEKTTALITAVKALQAGKETATAEFKAAVNCKGCHSIHKP